jgi:hypothetical protein
MKNISGLQVPRDPEALLKSLKGYEVQDEVLMRRDTREDGLMEEVALDLALSMDIFSGVPLVTHSSRIKDLLNDDELERATQALRITDNSLRKPPPVVLNFLRPRYPNALGKGVEGDMDGSGAVDLPLGVRQLLADWELGEDTSQFTFQNPYEEHEPTFWKRGRKVTGKKPQSDELLGGRRVEAQTGPQIPVIMASSQVLPTISTQRAVNRELMPPTGVTSRTNEGSFDFGLSAVSQPLEILSQEEPFEASSQVWLGTSTQILPHGGRPEAYGAMKKQKKRAKGF